MNKSDYVPSLKNTKLVIGNGFDLHCGLHTTYSDYYCKNWKKYRLIQKMYKSFINDNKKIDFSNEVVDSLNVWDVFFALNSSDNPYTCRQLWCDIEKLILSSLISIKETENNKELITVALISCIHWPDLLKHVASNTLANNDADRFIIEFVSHIMNKLGFNVDKYYEFLLEQLNEFELSFGKFIYCQIHDSYLENINYGGLFFNNVYLRKVKETLNDLCLPNSLTSIDSFNYSHFSVDEYKAGISYVNGSYLNPIFGIDSIFGPDDSRFIFTKTSRRIETNIAEPSIEENTDYENVIIFGHSLNEADYSYFFPVFDKLDLLSHGSKGKLIFAFSIFDSKKEQAIKSSLRQSVSKIILTYAEEKQVPNPKRFLDMISAQERILFYEIPDLEKRFSYMSDSFEKDWENMLKKMDMEIDN